MINRHISFCSSTSCKGYGRSPETTMVIFRCPYVDTQIIIIPRSVDLLYQLGFSVLISNTPSVNYGIDVVGAINTHLYGILSINLFPFSAISSSVISIDSRLNLSHYTLYIQINRFFLSVICSSSHISCYDGSAFLHTIVNINRIAHHEVLVAGGIELREDRSTLHLIQSLGTISESSSFQGSRIDDCNHRSW